MRAGLLAGFEAGASQAGHIGNGREPPDTALLVRRQGPVRGTSSNAHRPGRVSVAGSVSRPWPGRSGTGKMRRLQTFPTSPRNGEVRPTTDFRRRSSGWQPMPPSGHSLGNGQPRGGWIWKAVIRSSDWSTKARRKQCSVRGSSIRLSRPSVIRGPAAAFRALVTDGGQPLIHAGTKR
jgi:hypothetical protein